MPYHPEPTPQVNAIIRTFKNSLKRYFNNFYHKRTIKESQATNYYEEAKRAETEERNLFKALELYTRAIENGEKKDSSIKDFASSLHQIGYTKEAVRLMDDCESYYDGNKEKYFRLRDNLEIQINPTGKHLCRYILVENVSQDIKSLDCQDEVKNALFKSPKRIKRLYFFQDFQLTDLNKMCPIKLSNNILVEFESFSAAKKTLESFFFDQWFDSNLYWVNFTTMRITCAASDGKKDFEEGFIVDDTLIHKYIDSEKESFWTTFGEKVYSSRKSNGFINLLTTHLIKDYLIETDLQKQNKENIFEISKINQKFHTNISYFENSLQESSQQRSNFEHQKQRLPRQGVKRNGPIYKKNWY